MKFIQLISGLVSVLLWIGLAAPAHSSVLGTSALGELTGSRDVAAGGGLAGFNDYDNGFFTVAWDITVFPTFAHYEYTFTGLGAKDISNIVLDVTDSCEGDPLCVTNATIGGVLAGVVVEFGDFAGISGGIKLEGIDGPEGVVYAFDSNRLPVYGHLAVKDGGGSETCAAPGGSNIVCNNQLVGLGDPNDANDFIAVPNGVVPEPGTAGLLALGLGIVAAARRRHLV